VPLPRRKESSPPSRDGSLPAVPLRNSHSGVPLIVAIRLIPHVVDETGKTRADFTAQRARSMCSLDRSTVGCSTDDATIAVRDLPQLTPRNDMRWMSASCQKAVKCQTLVRIPTRRTRVARPLIVPMRSRITPI